MASVMAQAIRKLMDEDRCSAARRRFLTRIHIAPDRVARGRIQWTRDELHER